MSKGISYCLISNGQKPEKLKMVVNSIHNTMANTGTSYEINIAGKSDLQNVNFISAHYEAENGYLGRLRNIAASNSKYNNLVFLDDDILLSNNFYESLKSYSKSYPWDILGVKLLLPDGGRCWDRATVNPHTMIDYDEKEPPGMIYQTGGFWIIRKSVWINHKWSETLKFYEAEDVEYSKRLFLNGYRIAFDKNNTAWHYDEGYKQVDMACLRKKDFDITDDGIHTEEFKILLGELENV